MKRKRQLEETQGEELELELQHEPSNKKTRLMGRPRTTTGLEGHENIDNRPVKRRSSGRGIKFIADEEREDLSHSPEQTKANGVEKEDITDNTPKKTVRPKAGTKDLANGTPRGSMGKKLFATPIKTNGVAETNETPKIERNVDRSARRKSTRSLIERTISGNRSDNDEEEEDIARHIYDSEDGDSAEDGEEIGETSEAAPETPSKRKVGRPKGKENRKRSLSPLNHDLPPHEKYFSQNRGGGARTSDNNLSSLKLLDHEEYFSLSRRMEDRHGKDIDILQSIHAERFNQWQFELRQDFNICTYGWGSKKSLLIRFANYLYELQTDHEKSKIVIVNGYVPTLTIRDVLNTVAAAVSEHGRKLGSQPAEMLENLITLLEEDKSRDITLIIHSIDRIPLRRPATQTILSRLSSHPQLHLVASADHPSFPLLWDSSLRSTYNFLFHNCTTFHSYNAELDVVDEVHELLGRNGRRVGGKEGVIFVLRSLPENAKNLYKVLIEEQLAGMDEGSSAVFRDDYDDNDYNEQRMATVKKDEVGVEYRVLYQKAVEEFICSNDMNFRTLLKEFHDHQMIQSKKDALGTEILSIPFRKEELENILEDITS